MSRRDRNEVAALEREQWAGPWRPEKDGQWIRLNHDGEIVAGAYGDGDWWTVNTWPTGGDAPTIEAAKAAADEAMRATGWWLA